eukprot:TRINITY_DN18936_c0_g1_i2.p1 TRINITY_DN18936_c0_g1~~TRINITY_DN18936_c0_g1_i2.p1  ORF type:complete len:308 (+),score=78.23 TRINITY_DN18936_c0_g1_i2:42-965(+)
MVGHGDPDRSLPDVSDESLQTSMRVEEILQRRRAELYKKWAHNYESTRPERGRRRLPRELGEAPKAWLTRALLDGRAPPEVSASPRAKVDAPCKEDPRLVEVARLKEEIKDAEAKTEAARQARLAPPHHDLWQATRLEMSARIQQAKAASGHHEENLRQWREAANRASAECAKAQSEYQEEEKKVNAYKATLSAAQEEVSNLTRRRYERLEQVQAKEDELRSLLSEAPETETVAHEAATAASPVATAWASLAQHALSAASLNAAVQAAEEEFCTDHTASPAEAVALARLTEAGYVALRELGVESRGS